MEVPRLRGVTFMVSVSCKQSPASRNTRLLTFKFGKRYKRNRHQRYLSLSKLGSDYVNGGQKLRFVITYQERPALLFATARVFDTVHVRILVRELVLTHLSLHFHLHLQGKEGQACILTICFPSFGWHLGQPWQRIQHVPIE